MPRECRQQQYHHDRQHWVGDQAARCAGRDDERLPDIHAVGNRAEIANRWCSHRRDELAVLIERQMQDEKSKSDAYGQRVRCQDLRAKQQAEDQKKILSPLVNALSRDVDAGEHTSDQNWPPRIEGPSADEEIGLQRPAQGQRDVGQQNERYQRNPDRQATPQAQGPNQRVDEIEVFFRCQGVKAAQPAIVKARRDEVVGVEGRESERSVAELLYTEEVDKQVAAKHEIVERENAQCAAQEEAFQIESAALPDFFGDQRSNEKA